MTRGAPVAILTGAGTGIGRASALALAGHGYRLVLVGRRAELLDATKAQCEAVGADVRAVAADIGDPAAPAAIVSAAQQEFGQLDVVVNDAGTASLGLLADMDDAAIDAMFTVNVVGPLRPIRAAIPELERSDRAAIVNVTSGAGLNAADEQQHVLDPHVAGAQRRPILAAIAGLSGLRRHHRAHRRS
jgi:NADP-dependent 3-hydroxy acid dehydrogenase YdfG